MKSSGFTLLELLIATVILMSALTTAQLIYKNYLDTDQRFTADTRVYSALLDLVTEVRQQLDENTLTGRVNRGQTQCQFNAEQSAQARPEIRVSGALRWAPGEREYRLLRVRLDCSHAEVAVDVPSFTHTQARYIDGN